MRAKLFSLSLLTAALAFGGLVGCDDDDDTMDDATGGAMSGTGGSDAEPTQTIVEIAAGNEDFETLVAALTAADLVETLSGDGPFTVFAPTDAAFEALPEGTLDSLLLEENKDQLVDILTYHVVSGKVMAAQVVEFDGESVETVQGSSVDISVTDEGVMVDGANVIITDIEATNGVIHVIDAVILPE